MQWLGRGYTPARRTWYDFRDRVGDAVDKLHEQLIKNAIEQNLLDPAVGVQDGTSVAACASRHQMLNCETLNRRKELLSSVIEGTHPLSEPLPRWVPPTDTGRTDLAERMRHAAKILDEWIAENAAKQAGKRKNPAKILVSLTDPIAPFGRDKMKVFRPLYTIQYVTVVLPVRACLTWVANENNVMVASHFGSLDTAASRSTARAVHWRHGACELVHRVERSNVSKDRSYRMLSVPG